MPRPAQSPVVFVVLLALAIGACNERELLGINRLTPTQACAAKPCGAACSACSTEACLEPDVVGHCGADGRCTEGVPFCPSDEAGTGGQSGLGDEAGSSTPSGSADASPGCGKTGAPTGQLPSQTIMVAGQPRTYVLSVPSGYTGTTPLALVLVWHGANLRGSLARALFNLESKSDGAAVFVYPDGSATNAMTWDMSSGGADFQLFASLVSLISSEYCIDSHRIFSTGHSTGAMLTNNLGCYSDVLRAIAPVSGMRSGGAGSAHCTGRVAAWIAHGENDSTVGFSQGEAIRDFWIDENGCTTQTVPWDSEPACVGYQGCKPDRPVVWCVHDEDHAWPSLTFGCDGGICFDGGSAIWEFFSSFH